MNAKQLYFSDGTPAEIWQCGKCGQLRDIHSGVPIGVGGKTLTHEERLPYIKASAELCCDYKCETCGVKTPQFHFECRGCRQKQWEIEQAEKEKAAFARAKERTDYDGPFMFDDRYFETMEDVLERCENDEHDVPEYLWVSGEIKFEIDADHIIENALDQHHEDAGDRIGKEERDSLQDMLDQWCKSTGIVSYHEGRKEYVRVPQMSETKE